MSQFIFTSESVSEGHPDKIADQVSDAVLDACLQSDPNSYVACETFTTTGLILVGGELTTDAYIDIPKLVRDLVRDIGYTQADYGLDFKSVCILNAIHEQSLDIQQGVKGDNRLSNPEGKQGAGDQGMMFGYACEDTPELMPAPIYYAHQLMKRARDVRKSSLLSWLRPDAKSQVSIEYRDGQPRSIRSVVLSHQHDPEITLEEIREGIREHIIEYTLAETGMLEKTEYHINPTDRFVTGGPQGDAGLTGRKIIVDTYGGMGRHGGGAFSGKDPSKVDRSAAYMARYIAKNIVAAKLAQKCEVQLSYAIGIPEPISIMVNTFGSGLVPDEKIKKAVRKIFDLTPEGIITSLDLLRPIYLETACHGHFGNSNFSWERTDKTEDLQRAAE